MMLATTMTHESIKKEGNEPRDSNTMTNSMPLYKGAWTPEEDRKLAELVAVHGAKKWKMIAAKSGLNRCGKSCRLRWLNYLRPNIKRGNISDQEEDLILRLHKLLGNRWSLIAGRLPGRTDNEIKNYWNSRLSKKISQKEKQSGASRREEFKHEKRTAEKVKDIVEVMREEMNNTSSNNNNNNNNDNNNNGGEEDSSNSFNVDDFFDFSNEDPLNLKWMSQFLEMDNVGFTSMS